MSVFYEIFYLGFTAHRPVYQIDLLATTWFSNGAFSILVLFLTTNCCQELQIYQMRLGLTKYDHLSVFALYKISIQKFACARPFLSQFVKDE